MLRGATGSQKSGGGGKSIGVSRGAKGAKVRKPGTGAKGKKSLDYDSDDFLPGDDLTPKAKIVKSRSDIMGKHSVKELLKKIEEKDKEIRSLGSRLKITPRGNKIFSTQKSLPRGNYPNYPGNENYPGNHPWGNVFLRCPKMLPR